MKYVVIFAFLGIVGSLSAALFFMMRRSGSGKNSAQKMAWALALRVAISIALFASILLAWKLGYIQPSSVALTR